APRPVPSQQYYDGYSDGTSYQFPTHAPFPENTGQDSVVLPSPRNKTNNLTLVLRDGSEPISPGPPTALRQNTQPQNASYPSENSKDSRTPSGAQRNRAGSASIHSAPSHDLGAQ